MGWLGKRTWSVSTARSPSASSSGASGLEPVHSRRHRDLRHLDRLGKVGQIEGDLDDGRVEHCEASVPEECLSAEVLTC